MTARAVMVSDVDLDDDHEPPIEVTLDELYVVDERGVSRTLPRWPILLCGFIAGLAGGIAFMQSPLGATPEVQATVTNARASAVSAWRATVAYVAHFGEVGP